MVQSRSDKEVGAVLQLSPKTIENALGRLHARLGGRSRVELVGALGPERLS